MIWIISEGDFFRLEFLSENQADLFFRDTCESVISREG